MTGLLKEVVALANSLRPLSFVGSAAPSPPVLLGLRLSIWRLVGTGVKAPHQLLHRDLKDLANPQQCRDGNWTASFDLLPMSRGEAEGDHILLRVSTLLAKATHPHAQCAEELFLIRHALGCRVLRAD
jgi:hypothetical protein